MPVNGARPIVDERQALSGCRCSDTVLSAERTCSHDPLRLIQLHCSLYMPPRTQGRTSKQRIAQQSCRPTWRWDLPEPCDNGPLRTSVSLTYVGDGELQASHSCTTVLTEFAFSRWASRFNVTSSSRQNARVFWACILCCGYDFVGYHLRWWRTSVHQRVDQ